MMTEELSSCGYCCTGRAASARQPMSTITKLTTTASTGCLIKMSVNEPMFTSSWLALLKVGRLPDPARDARGVVCDRHKSCVVQLERSRSGHLLARGEPRVNEHLLADHLAA